VVAVMGVAAALVLSGAHEAAAYVQFRTASGLAMTWRPACFPVTIVVHPGAFSQMTNAEIVAAVTAAAGAWSRDANACTFVSFQVRLVTDPAPRAARDGANTIVFRTDSWCAIDATTGDCSTGIFYDPAAPVFTTVYAATTTGEIREADIEINAFHFQWADRVAHPDATDGRFDLHNILAQQMGHVLGFDWACVVSSTGQTVRPTDHTGQPAVDCASAPDSLRAATLYPSASPNDVERRTLAADDQAALCAIYPAAATTCPADAGQACMCPAPPTADGGQDAAGTPDAAVADAGDVPDATAADRDGGSGSADDGCSCAVGDRNFGRSSGTGLVLGWAALVALRARKRRCRPAPCPPIARAARG
jgi:hypothetical protein